MKTFIYSYLFLVGLSLALATDTLAQNPIICNQFTADPSARVFNGKVYLYPSHDIPPESEKCKENWFCMEDYHVFSSDNLVEWMDHGVILTQREVPWVDSTSYSMWAPDCIDRNGKYYFFFPSQAKPGNEKSGFRIGVAISEKPYGPFIPETEPIDGVSGIDPNPFIDEDGQAYLYWSAGNIYVAKLKDNMLELASEPKVIENLPEKGLKEGPYLFKRNGIYYLTYPHVENKTERIEYAISDNPLGPFEVKGVIMDESPNCWTNHHSIIEYNAQWYLFYHHNDLSPHFDKNRSVRIDSLFFNEDGTIQKVIPTLRGVGVTKASQKIQIDRYSAISKEGASIAFNDSNNTFEGWKAMFDKANAWLMYSRVDFGNNKFKSAIIRAFSKNGSLIQLTLNNEKGPVISHVKIPKGDTWQTVKAPVIRSIKGVQDLVVMLKNDNTAEIDWISFE